MTDHEGSWLDIASSSGQDDTALIQCSCGWQSSRIWSRLSVPIIQEQFAQHQQGAA